MRAYLGQLIVIFLAVVNFNLVNASKATALKRDTCVLLGKVLQLERINEEFKVSIEVTEGSSIGSPVFFNCKKTGVRNYRISLSLPQRNLNVLNPEVSLESSYLPPGHPWVERFRLYFGLKRILGPGDTILFFESQANSLGDAAIAVLKKNIYPNLSEGYWGSDLHDWGTCSRNDSECILVSDTFPCRCGEIAINGLFKDEFLKRAQAIKAYWRDSKNEPPRCEPCQAPGKQTAKCVASRCLANSGL